MLVTAAASFGQSILNGALAERVVTLLDQVLRVFMMVLALVWALVLVRRRAPGAAAEKA